MRHLPVLLRYELRTLLVSPATYVAAVLFLILMGILYHGIIKDFSLREHTVGPTEVFFQVFALPVLFMVPLLTMKAVAEERRLGTLSTLLSTPISSAEVVVAKFLAAWLFYCALWAATITFPLLATYVAPQEEVSRMLIDIPAYVGGLTFVCFSGLLFVAVGIFSSSMTRSQLVAGMLTFSILFILVLGPRLVEAQDLALWAEWLQGPLKYFNTDEHREDFARGILDSRPVVYYLTNTVIVLVLSMLVVESKA